jgi:hypothetical protein
MKYTIIAIIILTFVSCRRQRLTIYELNGVFVTRVDYDAESYFYFGKYEDQQKLPVDYIVTTYPGWDHVMSGFLIFRKDKTVTLVKMAGSFEKVGDAKNLNLFSFQSNLSFIEWHDKFKFKYDSIIRIDDSIPYERKLNTDNYSKVTATYLR